MEGVGTVVDVEWVLDSVEYEGAAGDPVGVATQGRAEVRIERADRVVGHGRQGEVDASESAVSVGYVDLADRRTQ